MKSPRFYVVLIAAAALLSGGTMHAQMQGRSIPSYTVKNGAVSLRIDSVRVNIQFYRPDIVRVDYLPASSAPDSSLVVIQHPLEAEPRVVENDSTLRISSDSMSVVLRKNPLRISYHDASGRLLLSDAAGGGFSSAGTERSAAFSLPPGEHLYGTGERGTPIDRRGQAFASYNTQRGGYSEPLPTMNINVPFLVSTSGYGIYFDNTYPGKFDIGARDSTLFSYTVEGGELTCYVMAARGIARQLEAYTWLTGRQPLPPRWAFGYIQSKYGYRNETDTRAMVDTMREKHIPCDAVVLDLYWFSSMGDLRWEPTKWPDPHRMMSDLLARGIKTIVITEPYIVSSSINFKEAADSGYVGRKADGQPYLMPGWWACNCDAVLLDITNPSAAHWWWNKHPAFFGKELVGIWTDLGEPERHPDDMMHMLGTARKVHNIYNLLWAGTLFEGFKSFRPNERLFNLTRSGFAGIQRYGVIPWSGDVRRSFGGLAAQPPIMLSMGLSGLAYQNSDIGGFTGRAGTGELYTRWMQMGVFSPITRTHGAGRATEPWSYGAETEAICADFIRLRYRLLPYTYTIARQNYDTGLPLVRPIMLEYPDEEAFLNESSAYLWGSAFLVAPVMQEGVTARTVTLPRGRWFDYWSDSTYDGGKTLTAAAPLGRIPLFVKAGSIIPLQQPMEYSDQRPLDTLTLAVYPGQAGGSFTLYEDDGKSLGYQAGEFARTELRQSVARRGRSTVLTLGIGPAIGRFAGQPARRVYVAEIHGVKKTPRTVRLNETRLANRRSRAKLALAGNGFMYDAVNRRLLVQLAANTSTGYSVIVEGAQLDIQEANNE